MQNSDTNTAPDTKNYVDTHYLRTLQATVPTKTLIGDIDADVCVVGGGIAGVSAAWELAARGLSVALVEAARIGWGASGRNGGLLTSGFAASTGAMMARSGAKDGRALYAVSREGVEIVLENTKNLSLKGVNPVAGTLLVSRYPDAKGMQGWQHKAMQEFGHKLDYLPQDDLRDLVKSDRFFDGLYDPRGYHIHPLNYCVGLAAELVRRGGQVFENSNMTSMDLTGHEKIVRTASGRVKSKYVVLCGSGYGGPEFGRLRRSLLPIATYVVSTKGLGRRAADIMNTPAAVIDTRLSCDYFRITPTNELLWGGGMSGLSKEPANLEAMMKQRIVSVFPQLKDVKIDVAWTGLMGYARHKMPYLQELQENVWTVTALGGHGLNTGPALGRVLAEAIAENGSRHGLFAPYGLRWNGNFMGALVADSICAASNFRHLVRERFAT